jgi:hypothetical protein
MARKKYVVEWTAEERDTLEQLQQKGTSSARKLTRARILLKADEGLEDEASAEAVGRSVATLERTRPRVGESTREVLNECPRPGGHPSSAANKKAADCGGVEVLPRGRARWTLDVGRTGGRIGFTDSRARETVRPCSKHALKPWLHKRGVCRRERRVWGGDGRRTGLVCRAP